MAMNALPIVWDMETSDPDDFLTLLLLLDHPQVKLKAVTITPGSTHQVGLVRRALEWFGRSELPVGARDINWPKQCVSGWHRGAYGDFSPSTDARPAAEVLLENFDKDTTYVTGASNQNLGAAMALAEARGVPFELGAWVAQGGFAGEGVVPPEKQLTKFKGRVTCPSFNVGGAPKPVLAAQQHKGFGIRRFVSKNVCHGVIYDGRMHEQFAAAKQKRQGLELIWKGMEHYLRKNRGGKAFHDPLAAACAIDAGIGTWAEVDLYREGGEWGSRLKPGSNTFIIVDYAHERFVATMLG